MKYIYDIVLNFQEILYDFFEWNQNDEIMHIKKIPIIEINSKDFNKAINNNVKIGKKLFNLIKEKTEIYGKKEKLSTILLKNNTNVIALKINTLGITTHISSLNVEDELDISELKFKKNTNFIYKTVSKRKKINTTRLEYKNQLSVEKIMNSLKIKEDEEKIKYIYLEYFGKKEKNTSKALLDLKNKIKYENFNKELQIFFKLTTNKI